MFVTRALLDVLGFIKNLWPQLLLILPAWNRWLFVVGSPRTAPISPSKNRERPDNGKLKVFVQITQGSFRCATQLCHWRYFFLLLLIYLFSLFSFIFLILFDSFLFWRQFVRSQLLCLAFRAALFQSELGGLTNCPSTVTVQ